MSKKIQPASQQPTKKPQSKREVEARQKRILLAFGVVTVALVALVLAYGYYQEYVVKPSQPVAIVNGTPISRRDYQALVRYERYQMASTLGSLESQLAMLDPTVEDQQFWVQYLQQQQQSLQQQASTIPSTALEELIDDELVRQEAARRGLQVTAAELQAEIETQFGYERNPPTPTPTPITATQTITVTPTPTVVPMTEEEFQTNYNQYIAALRKDVKFSEAAFRRLFESSLLKKKLQEAMSQEVPTTAEQVHASHILVATEEEAKKVLERLQAGESFEALAKELSTDTSNKDSGGDLGWFGRGTMVSEFENAAFALQPGQTSEPVQTSYGYHIIRMIERDPNRALDEETLASKRSSALEDWLTTQRSAEGVQRLWTSADVPE